MNILKKITWVIPAVFFGVWGYLQYKGNLKFFQVSLYEIMYLAVIVYITVYLVDKYANKRLVKESAIAILDKLEYLINDVNSYKISDQTDKDRVLMIQRQFKNKISILKRHENILGIKKEIEYIDNQYVLYCEFVGSHIDDFYYLKKSEKDLLKYLNLIDTKIDEIKIQLYR